MSKDATNAASEIVDESQSHAASTSRNFPAWQNALAGGVAGLSSRMATAPLDLVRIRRQLAVSHSNSSKQATESILSTWRSIMEKEGGVTALFRGNLAAVYLWISYSAVQFSLYNATKEALHKLVNANEHANSTNNNTHTLQSVVTFVSGATAGSCATLATYPFDVCRTAFAARGKFETTPQSTAMPFSSLVDPWYDGKQQQQAMREHVYTFKSRATLSPPPSSLLQFAKHLHRQQGYRGFYAGVGPAIVQIIPYMGVNFTIYEYLTMPLSNDDHDQRHGSRRLMNSAYAGSISGAVSKILVYPLDTVKRRLQGQALSVLLYSENESSSLQVTRSNVRYRNMVHCMRTMYRREGFLALYKGLVPAVYKSTVATALSFAVFQWTRDVLQNVSS
ncbi:hypothetical protein MPSEU_000355700 [Mayamaea pseudoterrestris]|nr:hypothetical protein MPSEU_000355700 [Mayamaea pseudoterrestris]